MFFEWLLNRIRLLLMLLGLIPMTY